MLLRLAILAICGFLLAPLDVIALPGAAWTANKVVWHDYMPAEDKAIIRELAASFNAAMPKKVPRVVYRPHEERSCAAIRGKAKRGISVCLVDGTSDDFAGDSGYRQHRHTFQHHVTMKLWPEEFPYVQAQNACHEAMHSMTGIPDVNANVIIDDIYVNTSCVWGDIMTVPGSQDVAYAERVYSRYDNPRARRRR